MSKRLNPNPIRLPWLASTELGRMVGDYISTSVIGNKWISIVPLSEVPDVGGRYRQHMFAAVGELDAAPDPQPTPKPACLLI